MPNPLEPRLEDWLDTLSLYQHHLHENTYLVAHSLGCPAILRFLERTQLREQLGGIILVSGFAKSLSNLKMLDEFTQGSFDDQKSSGPQSTVLSLLLRTIKLCHLHGARIWHNKLTSFYEVQHGGHF